MDDPRKKIIVAEIETWRRNNLLPEHYCVFLLNLYTEGDRPESSKTDKQTGGWFDSSGGEAAAAKTAGGTGGRYKKEGQHVAAISGKMLFSWLLSAFFIAGIILLAFHFNDFATPMQMLVVSGFSLIFYILAFVFRRAFPALTHLMLGLSFLLLALGGLYFIDKLNLPRNILLLFLASVCLLWCLNGVLFRFGYLLYCGMLGFGILYGTATIERIAYDYEWWRAELYWVPVSLLMIGLGFLMQMREHWLAGIFAICGMLLFFGAEIQALYVPVADQDLIQLLLFIKVFLCSVLFFLTRRYWFSWLRL